MCCNKAVNNSRAKDPDAYRKQNLAYYYKNKDELNEYRRSKWPEFYQSNLLYHQEKGRKYRAKYPEKIRAIARKRRATKKTNGWEKYTEAQVLELHGAVCHLCQTDIDLSLNRKIGAEGWRMSLQIDHVIPLSKGGPDILSNVKPAHARCNMDKSDKLVN